MAFAVLLMLPCLSSLMLSHCFTNSQITYRFKHHYQVTSYLSAGWMISEFLSPLLSFTQYFLLFSLLILKMKNQPFHVKHTPPFMLLFLPSLWLLTNIIFFPFKKLLRSCCLLEVSFYFSHCHHCQIFWKHSLLSLLVFPLHSHLTFCTCGSTFITLLKFSLHGSWR